MIVPRSILKRMNSVFGPPSTSSPLISWAGGDDGGGRGSKRKIEYDGSFNLANTMSDEKYRQLKEEASSSSSSDSEDDEDDNFHYGFEQIKLLPEPEDVVFTSKKLRADIDETSIMQQFIDAKECNCSLCLASFNNETSKWVEYYNEDKPTPVLTMLKTHEQKEHINVNCKRLVSIFKQFDNEDYKRPGHEADKSSSSSSSTSAKSTTGSKSKREKIKVDKSTIPDHVMYIYTGQHDNAASMHMFWMIVDYLPDFGSLSLASGGLRETYDSTEPVYDDDGNLFLGGIKYDGELVGGNKMNVFIVVGIL